MHLLNYHLNKFVIKLDFAIDTVLIEILHNFVDSEIANLLERSYNNEDMLFRMVS